MQTAAQDSIRSTAHAVTATTAEMNYSREVPAEHRRKFGQVFTPPRLAGLMADWVMGGFPKSLLEPAYGTGVLAAACLAYNSELNVTAYEIDQSVLDFARETPSQINIYNRDFLREDISDRFDAVIMNPPYIRHREISGYDKELSALSAMAGFAIPKSANLYIYFAVKSLELLRQDGRAAILIPAEWMSANFSKSFKSYLLDRGILKGVITFSNCSNVFDNALTTASVLLCQK